MTLAVMRRRLIDVRKRGARRDAGCTSRGAQTHHSPTNGATSELAGRADLDSGCPRYAAGCAAGAEVTSPGAVALSRLALFTAARIRPIATGFAFAISSAS